ncbi:Rieske 2Fe-2S domain-containing protein [Candidatus Bathyarchaeota archaeon]|nr:Rieske 2Fe-2S domain-containing protein [Candidatus Bathyarchaeota archaeon]
MSSHRLLFIKVAETKDISPGKTKKVKINEKEILIANVDGKYYTIDNNCTYDKADLSEGTLTGKILTCPKNKAEFDVSNGKNVKGPKMMLFRVKTDDLNTYEIKIDGNDILVHQKSSWGM